MGGCMNEKEICIRAGWSWDETFRNGIRFLRKIPKRKSKSWLNDQKVVQHAGGFYRQRRRNLLAVIQSTGVPGHTNTNRTPTIFSTCAMLYVFVCDYLSKSRNSLDRWELSKSMTQVQVRRNITCNNFVLNVHLSWKILRHVIEFTWALLNREFAKLWRSTN